jgi:ubiquitin-like domain-containing CTD phosphatase 1
MTPPRPNKKLLVMDLDYTLLDCKRWQDPSVSMIDFERPGLHKFLAAIYPYYDLAIWSQTHWRFLEAKLVELVRAYMLAVDLGFHGRLAEHGWSTQ